MTAPEAALDRCVAQTAERLADPGAVAAATVHDSPWIELGDDGRRPRWQPVSLSSGAPGIALLFAELAHHDDGYRRIAHAHLTAAVAHAGRTGDAGLQTGLAGLAFAARAAARSPADYATLLEKLDRRIIATAATLLPARRHVDGAFRGASFREYDAVSGLAGIGRYLLGRPEHRGFTADVLARLVAFTEPRRVDGAELPGWWVGHGPTPGMPDAGGHVNFGLAHGAAGPLALLAIAWSEGVRVPGHEEAIGRLADWFVEQRDRDFGGPDWPAALSLAEYTRGLRPDRHRIPPTWCYGAPGIAHAILLAGVALDEPAWRETARTVLRDVVERLRRSPGLPESMLCHGWSGLLQTFRRADAHLADPLIREGADEAAAQALAAFDPERHPFGFRARKMGDSTGLDMPGLLEGAAGTALALHAHARDGAPASGWDAALLLA
ncbi:Lanthionine synthetase C-like protein [Glycomyces sambucus]|uniref:Lanthionine synthetase C-like protein n=1 Tax=Glycomyces sambucus TaxID=380244 RepID=A0A1G9G2M7_9ACTN|nr:lanthionine synthetase C family protein [Glycomyces sambucus]SDK94924.1 Lanthionine synthetase C-like protein [Glycomyces sambucus]